MNTCLKLLTSEISGEVIQVSEARKTLVTAWISTEEYISKYEGKYTFTGGRAVGYWNLFSIP